MSAVLLALSAALLLLPGLVIGLAAGLRGWLLAAGAPVLTYGLAGVLGPLAPALGLRWSPWVLLGGAALFALGLAVIRGRLVEPERVWTRSKHLVVAGSVTLAAGVGVGLLFFASKGFSAIPQFWDAIFHGNAVRFIADSGNSAPSGLNVIAQPAAQNYFYPNGYHLVVATVHQFGASTVVQALNAMNALLIGVFALSMTALLRTLRVRAAIVAVTALLCCAFTGFPYDLLTWGPLYPYATGVALLPTALALVVRALDAPRPALVAVTALALVGLTAIHPSVSIAAAVFGLGLLAQRWLTARRVPLGELLTLAVLVAGALALGIAHVLGTLSAAGGPAYDWAVQRGVPEALGRLVFFTRSFDEPQWWLILPFVIGVLAFRRLLPLLWLLVVSLGFGLLSVGAAAYEGPWVALLTAPWWNDEWRLAALYLLAVLPVTALGLVTVLDLVRRPLPRRIGLVAAALSVLLFGYLSNGLYHQRNGNRLAITFGGGPTVTDLEHQAMNHLAGLVRPGEIVFNDAQDGSPWMWALTGVRPAFGHALAGTEGDGLGKERPLLRERFHAYDTDPEVRAAAKALGVRFVFIGQGFVTGSQQRAPGLVELDKVRSLRVVYENPDAKIYQLTEPDGQRPADQPGKTPPGGPVVVSSSPVKPKPSSSTPS
ncbi:DUF6541 family protein [Crossiella sp. NPDC003009]